eukprot:scaffold195_cov359-Prasinococcus_capsulatus_cf.AAC.10
MALQHAVMVSQLRSPCPRTGGHYQQHAAMYLFNKLGQLLPTAYVSELRASQAVSARLETIAPECLVPDRRSDNARRARPEGCRDGSSSPMMYNAAAPREKEKVIGVTDEQNVLLGVLDQLGILVWVEHVHGELGPPGCNRRKR